ncbi:hypothetical protein GCM10007855_21420 [Aliivibrio sifiae]|uniref:Transposase n=1 Tax=Aliivibrio sifiae TaxID=566293 RepID=A0ABQ6AIS8_9GAMM|nr:hypothetical protein GCM10007855_21420 [Aliivibrio sifiae]
MTEEAIYKWLILYGTLPLGNDRAKLSRTESSNLSLTTTFETLAEMLGFFRFCVCGNLNYHSIILLIQYLPSVTNIKDKHTRFEF